MPALRVPAGSDPFPERRLLPYEATCLEARRVLVVAPHADDETLGCGGTLAGLLARGARLDVLLVTDGAADEPDPTRRREIGEARLAETREALRRLGGGDASCVFLPDRGLSSRPEEVIGVLRSALVETLPDLVFVPSPVEVHPDHRAVAEAFLSLWPGPSGRGLVAALPEASRVAFYEVSQPIRPNVLVDVSLHAAVKEAAVGAFASQLSARAYDSFARGLGAYRCMTLPVTATSAEALFVLPVSALPGLDPSRLLSALGPTLGAEEVLPEETGSRRTERSERYVPASCGRRTVPRCSGKRWRASRSRRGSSSRSSS